MSKSAESIRLQLAIEPKLLEFCQYHFFFSKIPESPDGSLISLVAKYAAEETSVIDQPKLIALINSYKPQISKEETKRLFQTKFQETVQTILAAKFQHFAPERKSDVQTESTIPLPGVANPALPNPLSSLPQHQAGALGGYFSKQNTLRAILAEYCDKVISGKSSFQFTSVDVGGQPNFSCTLEIKSKDYQCSATTSATNKKAAETWAIWVVISSLVRQGRLQTLPADLVRFEEQIAKIRACDTIGYNQGCHLFPIKVQQDNAHGNYPRGTTLLFKKPQAKCTHSPHVIYVYMILEQVWMELYGTVPRYVYTTDEASNCQSVALTTPGSSQPFVKLSNKSSKSGLTEEAAIQGCTILNQKNKMLTIPSYIQPVAVVPPNRFTGDIHPMSQEENK